MVYYWISFKCRWLPERHSLWPDAKRLPALFTWLFRARSSWALSSGERVGALLRWKELCLPLRQAATDWACLPPVPPAATRLSAEAASLMVRAMGFTFGFLTTCISISYLTWASPHLYCTSLSLHEYIQCSFCLWFCGEVPVGNRLSQVVLTHILRGPREFERTKKSYSRYEAVLIKCEFVGAGCDSLVANETNG